MTASGMAKCEVYCAEAHHRLSSILDFSASDRGGERSCKYPSPFIVASFQFPIYISHLKKCIPAYVCIFFSLTQWSGEQEMYTWGKNASLSLLELLRLVVRKVLGITHDWWSAMNTYMAWILTSHQLYREALRFFMVWEMVPDTPLVSLPCTQAGRRNCSSQKKKSQSYTWHRSSGFIASSCRKEFLEVVK